MSVLLPFLLVCSTVLTVLSGMVLLNRLFPGLPGIFVLGAGVLTGYGLWIPLIYLVACLGSALGIPAIPLGLCIVILVQTYACIRFGRFRLGKTMTTGKRAAAVVRRYLGAASAWLGLFVIGGSIAFSVWIMYKTLRSGDAGQIFVGSNTIFDFGLLLGVVRSVSWGENIPIGSPYFAGAGFFYHVMFQFLAGMWEYCGVPLVHAVNAVSAVGFASLLIVVYGVSRMVFPKVRLAGVIGVLLTVTNASTAWLNYLVTHGVSVAALRGVWQMQIYPFAGPFDGSAISLFVTLNTYVNQRHLAYGVGLALVIYVLLWRYVRSPGRSTRPLVFLGILSGMLPMWNLPIGALTGVLGIAVLIVNRKFKDAVLYTAAAGLAGTAICLPLLPTTRQILEVALRMGRGGFGNPPSVQPPDWTAVEFLLGNLGILPVWILVGYLTAGKERRIFLPVLFLFVGECMVALVGKRGFDQKFYSFLIVPMNILAAYGLVRFAGKSLPKLAVVCLSVIALTLSGFLDLMPIKNEFAYPFVDRNTAQVIAWIRQNTPPGSVFVSYADMIDPVVLAGRKNYFGFYGNIGWEDRTDRVRKIYGGQLHPVPDAGISHILVPKAGKSDFPYEVSIPALKDWGTVSFENERFLIVSRVGN